MASTSTYVRDPSTGQFFSTGASGMVPVTDPATQAQLSSGAIPAGTIGAAGSAAVPAPSNPISAGGLSLPLSGSGASMTPSTGTATNNNPYTNFNNNIASILTQIQKNASQGRANLGGASDALTTESVGAAGAYNPQATPNVNVQNQQATMGAFAPAITSVNTQLQNANQGITDLEGSIGTIAKAQLPNVLSPGQSEVTPGGQTISQGHSYTPTINTNTGMMDGFDQNTGTWASDDARSGGGTPSGGTTPGSTVLNDGSGNSGNINAIFGASNPIGAYAADPNYVQEISGLYNTVKQIGAANQADTLDQYIKNNAGKAPVTGQMIINAAATYGIDPALLTTILLHESDFGTAGAAVNTMNPGNQGNTGTSTKTFGSWQQGVMATASNIANRINALPSAAAGGQPQDSGQQTSAMSAVGGSFNDAATQKVASLPKAIQSYVDAGPLGVAYINDDRVPANLKDSARILSAPAGIPYVQPADVGALKSMQTVLENLDSMQKLANNNLGSGILGRVQGAALGPANEALQDQWGRNLGLFDNYRDVAIKAVQALAGGAGSGLRINMGEIAANTQNLPKSSDNIENATAQIKQLKQLIYTQLATTFPYAPVTVVNPKGASGTIPASQLSSAIQKGYNIQ